MTQKITIEPVTRIEGHAKVTIHMLEDGTVGRAYMHVYEFRGFENSAKGVSISRSRRSRRAFVGSAR